jgi:hypothetical protein
MVQASYTARRSKGFNHAGQDYSAITLEIQRSLDYHENRGKGYINRPPCCR